MVNRRVLTLSILGATLVLSHGSSFAQVKKEQVAGAWTLVSYHSIAADGKKTDYFSAKPNGTLILDASGNYAMVLTNPERPKKFAGKNREEVSAEDYKSAGMGLVAQHGTWSVSADGKKLVRKVTGGFNPEIAGREQTPDLALNGDELKLTDQTSGVTGGKVEQTYRRVK